MHKNKASSNSNPIHIDNLALVSIRSENGKPVLEINGVTVETRMVVQPVPTFVKANIYKQYGSFGTECCQKLQEIQELLKNDGSLYCKEELYSTHRGWVYCTKFGLVLEASGDFVTINLLNRRQSTIEFWVRVRVLYHLLLQLELVANVYLPSNKTSLCCNLLRVGELRRHCWLALVQCSQREWLQRIEMIDEFTCIFRRIERSQSSDTLSEAFSGSRIPSGVERTRFETRRKAMWVLLPVTNPVCWSGNYPGRPSCNRLLIEVRAVVQRVSWAFPFNRDLIMERFADIARECPWSDEREWYMSSWVLRWKRRAVTWHRICMGGGQSAFKGEKHVFNFLRVAN